MEDKNERSTQSPNPLARRRQTVNVFAPQRTRKHEAKSCCQRMQLFLCRLDVCWTLFFFIFLVCIGAITTAITQAEISEALLNRLHDTHNLHIATLYKKTDLGTDRIFNMAAGFLSLHSEEAFRFRSENTLSTLCTILTTYDTTLDFRSLAVTSLELEEAIACMHGDAKLGSTRQLYGWVTENSVIPGVYLIDNKTYSFEQPLQPVYGGWPTSEYNLSSTIASLYTTTPVFAQAAKYYAGALEWIDYRSMWRAFATLPHIIYCTIPAGFLFRGLNLPPGVNVTDYVDVRINGAGILISHTSSKTTNITAAIFINDTLADEDPSIMSNNWGQQSVNDTELLATSVPGKVTYLKASEISDPLMREALKHINLKLLQQENHNRTMDFQYNGAPATATAVTLTTTRGLALPMVFVSSNADIAKPYRRIMDICNGVTAVVIVLFTVLFWLFVHRYMHQPLQRMSQRMVGNLRVGHREHTREPRFQLFRLTEAHALLQAHRATVTRLREIDAFIPKEVQEQMALGMRSTSSATTHGGGSGGGARSGGEGASALLQQLSTLVYVTVRPGDPHGAAGAAGAAVGGAATLAALAQQPHTRQRLASVVAHAARAAELVNSGPFPTPAALEAFVATLRELCEEHGGTVHRLTPDSCVLHFGKAVRARLTRGAGARVGAGVGINEAAAAPAADAATTPEVLACAARDAKSAMRFAFALLRWVDRCEAARMPDVRVLADTAEFICGAYRPLGSEATLSVALGRDVQRKLGHVPASIGVRVAMTEETASLVRECAAGCGVRQLPVESFHVGRAGLNADVVTLFEALPGPASGDAAWRAYQHCCFLGFSCMVRGNYAAALSAFKEVADISDLEPGLMPSSLRREAARSSITGGAVSTQVERLMRECVRRIVSRDFTLYYRQPHVPYGIDAVLGRVTPKGVAPEAFFGRYNKKEVRDSFESASNEKRMQLKDVPCKSSERFVVDIPTRGKPVRTVLGSTLEYFDDNNRLRWHVVAHSVELTPRAMWMSRFPCLGDAGAIAVTNFIAFRDVPPIVAKRIANAPLGPMSDELRSAVPVCSATSQQIATVQMLFDKQRDLQHPNLQVPYGYSTATEGGLVLVWEYNSGGTLRELAFRYAHIKVITAARFMQGIASALAYLHQRGVLHCAVSLDGIWVREDGVCRMRGHNADLARADRLFLFARSFCTSPAMAANKIPTPACDIFSFGLTYIELLTRKSPWKWAPVKDDRDYHSEEELRELMSKAEQPFFDAVADGRIVVNKDVLDALPLTEEAAVQTRELIRACVAADPAARPTAEETFNAINGILILCGKRDQSTLLK